MLRILLLALTLWTMSPSPSVPYDTRSLGNLRLNQLQMIGTHNSYHQAPDASLLGYLRTSGFADGDDWTGPKLARAIDYAHPPLTAQLDEGIRALELDVHDDPDGTRFVRPPFLDTLASHGLAPDRAWDPNDEMKTPGFKTLHKPAYDPRSSCPIFRQCLEAVARWSDRHPDHEPIVLMIEVKRESSAARAGCVTLCPAGWARLKAEMLLSLGRARLILPSEARQQWPSLEEARGHVLVMLLDTDSTAASYRRQTDQSGDDIMFTALRPTKRQPLRPDGHSRIAILPDPADPRIADARRAGFLVYTRADADTEEARANSTARREAAFQSGANFIATDYPDPDPRLSDYRVRFGDGGFDRCNVIVAKKRCNTNQ